MENTNSNLTQVRDTFDMTRDWIVTRRRALQFNTIILLAILSIFVMVMSAGSIVQAIVAAHQPFLLTAPFPAIVIGAAPIVVVIAFVAMIIFSYFTNLSQQEDHVRELKVDGLVLVIAAFVPQAIYHITWLATTFFIVTSRNYILTKEMFVNVNFEWLLSVGMIVLVGILGWLLRNVLLDTTVIEQDAYSDFNETDPYSSRRVYE